MKIALISDIHGNFVALETVLTEVEKEHVDQTVCLGDVAQGGPQPHECVARLRELGSPTVMGNTDEFFIHPPNPDPYNQDDRRIMDMLEWATAQLAPGDLDFIKTFQARVEVPLDGGQTLLCFHGSPQSNRDVILATTPYEELTKMVDGFSATMMAGGHTHTQMLRRFLDKIVINPGSVGMPIERGAAPEGDRRPPWGEYAVLTSEKERLGIELRRVPLDVDAMIAQTRASGMPHGESWAAGWRRR